MSTPLQRIPRVEFFAVLPAGVWILGSITLAWLTAVDFGHAGSFAHRVKPVVAAAAHPVVAVVAILMSYLLGHIPRAMGLALADRISVNWFRLWAGGPPRKEQGWRHISLLDEFPYQVILERTLRNVLLVNAEFPAVAHPGEKALPRVGTYHEVWKTIVRQNSPEGYAHLESLEARARMYTGLFWAGVFGALCGLVTIVTIRPEIEGHQGLALEWLEMLPAAFLTTFILFGHWRSQCERSDAEQLRDDPAARTSANVSRLLSLHSWLWGAATLVPGVVALVFRLLCGSLSTHGSMALRLVGLGYLFALILTLAIFPSLLSPGTRRRIAATGLRTHAFGRRLYALLALLTVIAFLLLPVLAGPLSVWMAPAVALTLGSSAIAVTLGARIRSVRAEESQKVLLAYLATMTDEKGELKGKLAGIEFPKYRDAQCVSGTDAVQVAHACLGESGPPDQT